RVKVDALPESPGSTAELWTPPIFKCIATRNEGVSELVAGLERHYAWIETTEAGRERRRARLLEEVRESLREALIDAAAASLSAELEETARAVEARTLDPYTASERLVARFKTA